MVIFFFIGVKEGFNSIVSYARDNYIHNLAGNVSIKKMTKKDIELVQNTSLIISQECCTWDHIVISIVSKLVKTETKMIKMTNFSKLHAFNFMIDEK